MGKNFIRVHHRTVRMFPSEEREPGGTACLKNGMCRSVEHAIKTKYCVLFCRVVLLVRASKEGAAGSVYMTYL
jgi:hypothetical protein